MKLTDQSKKSGLCTALKKHSGKICLGITLLTLLLLFNSAFMPVMAENEDESVEEVHYLGKVTGKVNVRSGPGENNERLIHNGEFVQLKPGEEVVILGEAMVGTKPWYNIEFEINGVVLNGYSTSSYITKTDIVITPKPSPTPEPTPTPKPSPTPSPTLEPIETGPAVDANEDLKKSSNSYIVPIIILVVAGGICIAVLVLRKASSVSESNEMTKAVKKLQNVKLDEKNAGVNKNKKSPEIKSSSKNLTEQKGRNQASFGIYVKDDKEDSFIDDEEDDIDDEKIKPSISKDNDERKRIKKEIDSLIEHDMVEHKYFGKGEVFDNSDVKLIEVRFGNDVRFLNKDSLVSKKLLKKSSGGNTRWNN